jgi:hypothetical protein
MIFLYIVTIFIFYPIYVFAILLQHQLEAKVLCQYVIRRVTPIRIHIGVSMTIRIPVYNCLMMVLCD